MHRKMILLSVVSLMLAGTLLHSSGLQARGWEWARRMPISQHSPEDTAIFHAQVDLALDEADDGERVEWSNPDSGASGVITPLSTEQIDGRICRKTRFENKINEASNVSEFLLCQLPDGSWTIGN